MDCAAVMTQYARVGAATIRRMDQCRVIARYGVGRGLEGEYPSSYDDETGSYTPAWQERWSGVDRKTVLGFARDWANTALVTDGKCSIIIGAGINH